LASFGKYSASGFGQIRILRHHYEQADNSLSAFFSALGSNSQNHLSDYKCIRYYNVTPMNQTYIYKNEQQLGPFDDSTILQSLANGTFSWSDLCWRENWEGWKPLDSVYPKPSFVQAPISMSKTKMEGFSIASLVCSLLFLGIPAIICGHIARSRIKRDPVNYGGAGMALAGLILGYIETIIPLFVLVVPIAIYTLAGNIDVSKEQRASSDIQSISMQLRTYEMLNYQRPTTEQGLNALVELPSINPIPEHWKKLMDSIPKDPWGHEYVYHNPGQFKSDSYDLYSLGPKGVEGDGK